MRTKKKSSGKIPEKKSAVPYKSTAPHRHTFQTASDSQTAEIADAIQTNRGASGFATYKIS